VSATLLENVNTLCSDCPVKSTTLCATTNILGHTELSKISHVKTVPSGGTVLGDDAEASFVATVLRGVVRVTKSMRDGREQIVGLVYPGEFFGRLFADRTSFSYEAASDLVLCVMDRHGFEAVLQRHPELEHEIMLRGFNDLARAYERSMLLTAQSTLERVSTYLLVTLDRREQLLEHMSVELHKRVSVSVLTRRDMASYLGTTIETISRHVHYLAAQGVIRIIDASHFEVLNHIRLMRISGLTGSDLAVLSGRPPSSTTSAVNSGYK